MLTGLADGVFDGDLTIGASALLPGSTGVMGSVSTDAGSNMWFFNYCWTLSLY